MTVARVPERLQWAVQELEVDPEDQILEIGCGPGVALALICEQLSGGRITAIDRSATAVRRAEKRNAAHLASGKAVIEHVELAQFDPAGRQFDVIFAVNVNLFWVRPAPVELRLVTDLLREGGVLSLFYEALDATRADAVAAKVAAVLEQAGWETTTTTGGSVPSIRIRATLPGATPPSQSS